MHISNSPSREFLKAWIYRGSVRSLQKLWNCEVFFDTASSPPGRPTVRLELDSALVLANWLLTIALISASSSAGSVLRHSRTFISVIKAKDGNGLKAMRMFNTCTSHLYFLIKSHHSDFLTFQVSSHPHHTHPGPRSTLLRSPSYQI